MATTRKSTPAREIDYKKLGNELLEIPATKYVLGGIVLAGLLPLLIKLYRERPVANSSISDKVTGIKNKFEDLLNRAEQVTLG